MHISRIRHRFTAVLGGLIVLSLLVVPAAANNVTGEQWGTYQWPRPTSGTLSVKVRDNTTTASWHTIFGQATADWNNPSGVTTQQWQQYGPTSSQPNVLRDGPAHEPWSGPAPIILATERGTISAKQCKPSAGRIEICNAAYGKRGWEGIAQIWTNGDLITQATAKMNDTYFTPTYYPQPGAVDADRLLVMCQEMAHGFGLDHDDENFGNPNTGTCMDYGNSPFRDGHPRWQDFDMLRTMYGPTSTTTATTSTTDTTTAASEAPLSDGPSDWGQVIERDDKGRPTHYRKDLGNGKKVFTFVIYADEAQGVTVDPGTGTDGSVAPGEPQNGKPDNGGKKADSKRDDGKKADGKKAGGKKADSKKQDGKKDEKRHR